jgi:mRNA interferase MazF
MAMTSNPAQSAFSFLLTSQDLVEGALNRPGTVRVDKVYTLAQSIVVKKFGRVAPQVLHRMRQVLDTITAATP